MLSSSHASQRYQDGLEKTLTFIRHLRYLQRDGRHAALLVWNGESLEKEAESIDTLAATLRQVYVTTFVASWGDKRASAPSALCSVRDSLRASGSFVKAAILVAHGLPQEDTMRHVHAIVASEQPLRHGRIFSFLQERWQARIAREPGSAATRTPKRQRPPQFEGGRASSNRLAILEDQQGIVTFRQHVRRELEHILEPKAQKAAVRTWQSLHTWFGLSGLRYSVDRFGNGIVTSDDDRWRIAASKIDARLTHQALERELGLFTLSTEKTFICGYTSATRSERFTEQQWAAYEDARRHYREWVQPKILAELAAADQRYRYRLMLAAEVKTLLQLRTNAWTGYVHHPAQQAAIEQLTRRAKARIKKQWFSERGAVYAAHEPAPARTLGRWLTHRRPALPPATFEAALQLVKARAAATHDGTDYYQDDIRIATQVRGVLRTTIPSLTRAAERALKLESTQPSYEGVLWVSGPAEILEQFRLRFSKNVEKQLDHALFLRPRTRVEHDSLEQAARELKLRVGDPYALAQLERDGKAPPIASPAPTQTVSRTQSRPLHHRKRRGRY